MSESPLMIKIESVCFRGYSCLQGIARSEVRKCADQSILALGNEHWREYSRGINTAKESAK